MLEPAFAPFDAAIHHVENEIDLSDYKKILHQKQYRYAREIKCRRKCCKQEVATQYTYTKNAVKTDIKFTHRPLVSTSPWLGVPFMGACKTVNQTVVAATDIQSIVVDVVILPAACEEEEGGEEARGGASMRVILGKTPARSLQNMVGVWQSVTY